MTSVHRDLRIIGQSRCFIQRKMIFTQLNFFFYTFSKYISIIICYRERYETALGPLRDETIF